MRKIPLAVLKKKREIRGILFTIIFLACICSLPFLKNWMEGRADSSDAAVMTSLYAFGFLWILIMLFIKKATDSEYDIVEETFERRGMKLIRSAFGLATYQKLTFDDGNFIPLQAIEVCLQMLQSQEAKTDTDLRFHILVKLARYYARDGQPHQAVEALQSALALRPFNSVANSRLAERFEMTGAGDEAITHYESAQKDETISASLKDHFAAQVKRVQTEGPRKSGPFDGSGIWWMWGS